MPLKILTFRVNGFLGAVHLDEISGILPRLEKPSESVLYASPFPSGLTVDDSPADIIYRWAVLLEEQENEDKEHDSNGNDRT